MSERPVSPSYTLYKKIDDRLQARKPPKSQKNNGLSPTLTGYDYTGYESAFIPTIPQSQTPRVVVDGSVKPRPIPNNPSELRLDVSGLKTKPPLIDLSPVQINVVQQKEVVPSETWKVKIKLGDTSIFNFNKILKPLSEQGGIIFPYTPQIQINYQANYIPQRVTHSNYTHFAYEASEIQAIQITAQFSAQTESEAEYVLACIYFLRSCTKMFFGQGALAGNPPPLVFLEGYGTHYLPKVPCIVTNFQHTMPDEVDYMLVNNDRIPTLSQITLGLQPVYSKKSVTQFDLKEFSNGSLISKKFI